MGKTLSDTAGGESAENAKTPRQGGARSLYNLHLRHAAHYITLLASIDQKYEAGGQETALALFDVDRGQLDAFRSWLWAHESNPEIDALILDEAIAGMYLEDVRNPVKTVQIPRWERVVEIARRRGDRFRERQGLAFLSVACITLGEVRQAIIYQEQNVAIAREMGDRRGEGSALGNLGNAYADLGDLQTARSYHEQSVAIAREVGDRDLEGSTLLNLGLAYLSLGAPHNAIDCLKLSLAIAQEMGNLDWQGMVLGALGLAYVPLKDAPTAIGYFEQALAIAHQRGDRHREAWMLGHLGSTHHMLGNFAEAATCCKAAQEQFHNIGDYLLEGVFSRELANAQAALGQTNQADANYQNSLSILDNLGDIGEAAITRWAYGQFLVRQNKRESGLALMQESIAYDEQISHSRAAEHTALLERLRTEATPPS